MSGRYLDLLVVAAASGLVGLLEIAERFRDDPLKAIATAPAWVYIAINSGAGVLALLLLRLVDVRFGVADSGSLDRWGRVVAAGFSAVIVLRSTVFVPSEGSGERSYGLSNFIVRALQQAETRIGRVRGPARADAAEAALGDLTYGEARSALGALALGQVPLSSEAQRKELAEAQAEVDSAPEVDEVKVRLLAMAVLNFGGEEVLVRAASQLRAALGRRDSAPKRRRLLRRG